MIRFFGNEKINPTLETFTIFAEEKRLNKSTFVQDLPYDDNTVNTLSQAISNGLSDQKSLQKINFVFLINSDFLSRIQKNENQFTKESIKAITMIVYFNAMGFIYSESNFIKTLNSEILFYLLYDLKLCSVEIQSLNSNLRQESNAFFFHSVVKKIFSDQEYISNLLSLQNLELIQDYLELPYNKLDSTFTETFIKICKSITILHPMDNSPSSVSEIASLKKRMLEDLHTFLTEKRSFVSIDDCKVEIFVLISPEIKNFDDNALKIFAWMTHNAKLKDFRQLFVTLPYSLIEQINKLDKDKLPQFEEQKEFNYDENIFVEEEEEKEEDKYTFIVSDQKHKSFPNGIEALPSVFFQKFDSIEKLFQPKLKVIIDKLANLLEYSNNEFSLNFFNNFPDIFKYYSDEKNQDAFKIFPLVYAVYLILLKPYNLTKKLLDSQKNAWNLKYIFNPKHLIFGDGYLCPLMNRFRNEVFELLVYTDPNDLIRMFDKNNPFLYAEHLGRILSKTNFDSVNKDNIDENDKNDRNTVVFQKLADNESFCKDVITVARQLQQINLKYHSKLISKMRNCVFLFTFNIARYKRFESKSFGPYFFDFLFESEITDVIINIIEKYYIFYSNDHVNDDAVIGRILKALNICSKRSDNELYSNLAIKLTKMVHNIMHHNLNSIHYFSSLLDVILKNFLAKQSVELLNHILAIILFISMEKCDFCPKIIYLQKMADFIKNLKHENKNERRALFNRIMCLLKNSTQFTRDSKDQKKHQSFLIKRPQFIPFLIASFGSTKKFIKILKMFNDICKISWSNIVQCHRGCLDTILILFLTQRKERTLIYFGGLQIDIKMGFIDQKVSILPILFLMNSFISSYSNASHYLNYCSLGSKNRSQNDEFFDLLNNNNNCKDTEDAIQTFMTALTLSLKYQMYPFLLISPIPTNSIGKGLPSSFAQGSFSICFFLRLDLISISENESKIVLFDIKDTKTTSLAVFLIGPRLFLRYDHNYVRTQVKLIDYPCYTFKESRKDPLASSIDWHFINITLVENTKTHSISVRTTMDFEKPVTSEMSKIMFHNMNSNDEKLTIDFGNAVNNKESYSRYEYGFISQFRIFNRKLKKQERIQLALKNFNYVNDDIKIEIKAKQAKIIPKNLIQQFENVSLLFKFLDAFEDNKSLQFFACLRTIFDSSIVTQSNISKVLFDHKNSSNNNFTKRLSEILTEICFLSTKNSPKEAPKLTIQFYMTAYSIMEVITDEYLRDRWLHDILLNLYIWGKVFTQSENHKEIDIKKSCIDNVCLPFIVEHWISVLFVNCIDLFKKNSFCLMTILNQMEKLNIEHLKSNQYLLKFSVMVSLLNFDQFDTSFRNHYPQLQDLQMINFYLDILLKIAKSIDKKSHPDYYSVLYTAFNLNKDPSTLIKIIKIIYLMEESNDKKSKSEDAFYDEFLKLMKLIERKDLSVIIKLFLILYSNKPEISGFESEFVYENSVLNEYPNLFSILIMISIIISSKTTKRTPLKKSPEKIVGVLHVMNEKRIKISTNGIWYIFPIILAFNTIDTVNILTFLSRNVNQSDNTVRNIFYLLNLFESIQNNNPKYNKKWQQMTLIETIHYSFLSFLPRNEFKITETFLELCLFCTFYHLDVVQPFNDLYNLLNKENSSIVDKNSPKIRRSNSYDSSSVGASEDNFIDLDISSQRNTMDLLNEEDNIINKSILDLNSLQYKIGNEPCDFEINSIKDIASDFLVQSRKYCFYYKIFDLNMSSDSLFRYLSDNINKFDSKIHEDYIKLFYFFYNKSDDKVRTNSGINDKPKEQEEYHDLKLYEAINETLERMRIIYQDSFNKTINSFFSRIKNKIKEVQMYFENNDVSQYPKFSKAEYNVINNILIGRRRSSYALNYQHHSNNVQLDYKKSYYLSRFCPFKLKFSPFVDYNDKNKNNEQQRVMKNSNKPTVSTKKPIEKPHQKFFTQPKYFIFEKTQYKANWIRLYKQISVVIQFGKNGLFFSNKDNNVEKVIKWQETTMIFQMSQTMIEFVICDKKSYLFEFESTKIATTIVSKIKEYFQDINSSQNKLKNKNKQHYQAFQVDKLFNPSLIIESNTTNFDYLIRLNYLNGRSFNLRDKYPVFPQFFDDLASLKIKNIDKIDDIDDCYFEYFFFKAYNGDKSNKFDVNNYSPNDSAINFSLLNVHDSCDYLCVPPEFYILPEVLSFETLAISEDVDDYSININQLSKTYDESSKHDDEIEHIRKNKEESSLTRTDIRKSGTKIRNASIYFDMAAIKTTEISPRVTTSSNTTTTTSQSNDYDDNNEPQDSLITQKVNDDVINENYWFQNKFEFCSKMLDFLETDKAREYIKKWEKIVFPPPIDITATTKKIEHSIRIPKKSQQVESSSTSAPPSSSSSSSTNESIKKANSSQIDSNLLESNKPISYITLSDFEYCIVIDSKNTIYFYQVPLQNTEEGFVDVKNEKTLEILGKHEVKNCHNLIFIPFNNSTISCNFQYIFGGNNSENCGGNYYVSKQSDANKYIEVDQLMIPSECGYSNYYCFASNRPILLAYDTITMALKIFDSKSVTDVNFFCQSLFNFRTNLFSLVSTNEIFYCESGSVIKTVFSDFTHYSEKEITCIMASSEFGIVVYSTIDGFVHIVSFSSSPQEIFATQIIFPQKVGDLNDEILSISITKNFGFIVIHSTLALTVLTVNGSIVCFKKKLQNEIVAISSFTSQKGIDYVCFVDENNKINFFKAADVTFCLDDSDCQRIKKSEVVSSIRYDVNKKAFFVQTMSCKLFVFPYDVQHSSEIEKIAIWPEL